MRYKNTSIGTIILLGIGIAGLQAQEAIPATGNDAYGNGGSASYSVGQLVFNMNTGTNGSEAQGVQQPYEISVVIGIGEVLEDYLELTAYPNPATDYLMLRVDSDKLKDPTTEARAHREGIKYFAYLHLRRI